MSFGNSKRLILNFLYFFLLKSFFYNVNGTLFLRNDDRSYLHLDEIIYVLLCENDKFYIGHTTNFESRLKYGHFGKVSNRNHFLRLNPPQDLLFFIRTGIIFRDHINIHDLEDYVTVIIVSKKYGAENVFGGFRYLRRPYRRIKFVEEYDYFANEQTINLIDPLIDFELPEIFEIKKKPL